MRFSCEFRIKMQFFTWAVCFDRNMTKGGTRIFRRKRKMPFHQQYGVYPIVMWTRKLGSEFGLNFFSSAETRWKTAHRPRLRRYEIYNIFFKLFLFIFILIFSYLYFFLNNGEIFAPRIFWHELFMSHCRDWRSLIQTRYQVCGFT